jgi:putative hemolysin
MNPLTEFLLVLLLLLGSGFYSGMETGIVSVNRVRLRHMLKRKNRRALQLHWFMEHPDDMLATTLVGTNLCNTAMTVLGTQMIVSRVGDPRLGNLLASAVLLVVILVFGEYLPKAWFQSHPLDRSARYVPILRLSAWLFRWLSLPVTALSRAIIPAPKNGSAAEAKNRITRKDIQFLLSRESGATPDLSEPRRRMVEGVFSLSEKTARDVMLPREQMISIRQDMSIQNVLELARQTPAQSFPVFSPTEKRFTGILKISDLYARIDDPDIEIPHLLRPPQYVAEDTPADDLLPRLRLSRQPMLLVRDDHDRVTGFVTTEVVLEEIVGPLYERSL